MSKETSADILVVLGAQHSAQRRYREALFCIDKALQEQPKHVRAHYSRGQVRVSVCVRVRVRVRVCACVCVCVSVQA